MSDARELLEFTDLKAVRANEIVARRRDEPLQNDEPTEWKVLERHESTWMECRFRVEFQHREAEYVIDYSTNYNFSEPLDLAPSVPAEFVEKVAVMAVYPFIREAVHSSAARLGVAIPVLGLMKQGQFSLNQGAEPMGDAEPAEEEDYGS